MHTALWWVRRDLRLGDTQALSAALQQAEQVVPVFVRDPALWNSPYAGEKRLAFMLAGLQSLDADLRKRGSYLVVREGCPVDALRQLVAETGATAIFAEKDFSPYATRRDQAVAQYLPLHLTGGLTVQPPEAVLKKDGTPYIVYTPFNRSWKALPLPVRSELIPAPKTIPTPPGIARVPLPTSPALPASVTFVPGETEGQKLLQTFTMGADAPVYVYQQNRDLMASESTSRLSPYLRFGMVSARQAVVTVRQAMDEAPTTEARRQAQVWLAELIWREFYQAILFHFPGVRKESFRENLRSIAWDNNPAMFAAWCAGRTGYPVVDAAMRQLAVTGWMHNRARMIVASFLTKDLLIDWRWGEQYFMEHLLDGDPAANNGGWQWSAGTGTDAAPYFRIFNPVLQGQKYDPQGHYVRRWVPELVAVPEKFIHQPWKMSPALQEEVGCVVGRDYPAPIVDHHQARERTLAAYKAAKENY
ncbi:MAG: deoxyribodipyrimidine photo-lyase [Anaerolineae bacterium]|nr:deoxyribodipyrimidine photo-lyase [Anaerolineae bacterium]